MTAHNVQPARPGSRASTPEVPSGWRRLMMCAAVAFYAFFAIGTLVTQVQENLL
jgi:hypothetical protein